MIRVPDGAKLFQAGKLHADPDGREFFDLVETYLSGRDLLRVREAFEIARQQHGDQLRKSGELFFTHPLTVAYYLAEYRLDADAIIAALLHDVAEDTLLSISEIRETFDAQVSHLVDGVTKLKEVTAEVSRERILTPEEVQDASLHKMFDAMTADVRVVLVKLFDRLHNMRTIHALPRHKQQLKAEETLSVYAPLANRLGIWRLKSELEALSLEVLNCEAHRTISQALEQQYHNRQAIYAVIFEEIIEYLRANGVKVVNVVPNPENVYSIYRSLADISAPFNSARHPLRVVVLLDDVPSCYLALGHLHAKWRPVPGKFDDYIAAPRENLYRALHTTVIYSDGQPLKIRFRSLAMNEVSEIGVLARWVYAGTPLWTQGIAERVDALFAHVNENIHLEPQDFRTGVKGVVEDVFRQQIMVYTPRGDIIELPLGATPIDFAYAIHTEVGNRIQSAYVNDQPHPLNAPLSDGDQVLIVKSGWARPHRTWLDEDLGFLATSRARYRVRRWFRRLPEAIIIPEGRQLLQDELDIVGMPDLPHEQVAEMFGYEHLNTLYHDFGRAELLPTEVATRVIAQKWREEPSRLIGSVVKTEGGQEVVISHAGKREVHLCRSCRARPGDAIVGFLRSDGRVTVHKEGCYTLRPDPMADRRIKLSWGKGGTQEVSIVTVQIDVYDRAGLLFDIANLLRDENVNISAINTPPGNREGTMRVILDLEVTTPRQLVRILHRAHALDNVYAVCCLRPQTPE